MTHVVTNTGADPLIKRIDAALGRYSDFGKGCPTELRSAIRYSLLAPGKRLRPRLVLLAAAACDGSSDNAMPAACAVEMVHAYSLIHDDLPAMDDDDLRRGQPTCHKVFGEAIAILAGDALLARAFEIVASEVEPADVSAECAAALGEAAGATALVGGQVDDLAGCGGAANKDRENKNGTDAPLDWLESIHARKTGALFRVSLRLGGLVARASSGQLAALAEYGGCFGLAFQITDDLLDVAGDEASAGKRLRKDSGHGKMTYPGVLGSGESRRRARELIQRAIGALAPLGEPAQALADLGGRLLDRRR